MKIAHLLPFVLTLGLTACVTSLPSAEGEHRAAAVHLKAASQKTLPAAERAALYLESAREASALLASPTSGEAARQIYNKAAADLTILLRESDGGRNWNRPQTIAAGGGAPGA